MKTPPESIRELARRLLAIEAENHGGEPGAEAARVLERLRESLSRFAGPDGFAVLFRRATVLARAEQPSLPQVKSAGEYGLDDFLTAAGSTDKEAVTVLVAYLLGLLVTFIGEQLTIRLVRDAWPDVEWEE